MLIDRTKLATLIDTQYEVGRSSIIDYVKLAEYDRSYYMQHRAQIGAKNRSWRLRNQVKIHKRERIYKRQLKMGRKPRKRMGGDGSPYKFVSRGGVSFGKPHKAKS